MLLAAPSHLQRIHPQVWRQLPRVDAHLCRHERRLIAVQLCQLLPLLAPRLAPAQLGRAPVAVVSWARSGIGSSSGSGYAWRRRKRRRQAWRVLPCAHAALLSYVASSALPGGRSGALHAQVRSGPRWLERSGSCNDRHQPTFASASGVGPCKRRTPEGVEPQAPSSRNPRSPCPFELTIARSWRGAAERSSRWPLGRPMSGSGAVRWRQPGGGCGAAAASVALPCD